MNDPSAVFVYGTLKRGQSRETCWPRKPTSVESATVRGELYDLGPYPGLIEGGDVVAGELWRFAAEDMQATFETLDEIEGIFGREDDEYRRVIVECFLGEQKFIGWTYHYARRATLTSARRIAPNRHGICEWPGPLFVQTSTTEMPFP